jgi:hypothetical protein
VKKIITYEPIMVDKDTVTTLMRLIQNETQASLGEVQDPVIDLEWFVRMFARLFIEAAGVVGEEEFGVGYDLQKIVAYGLTNGALDMMYKTDPNTLRKVYAERRDLDLN